jgi:hypothetical protein
VLGKQWAGQKSTKIILLEEKAMNYNMYSLERIADEIMAQRVRDAKSYRLWQKARKALNKRTK